MPARIPKKKATEGWITNRNDIGPLGRLIKFDQTRVRNSSFIFLIQQLQGHADSFFAGLRFGCSVNQSNDVTLLTYRESLEIFHHSFGSEGTRQVFRNN